MAEEKKSFLLYTNYIDLIRELTDEEAGRLIKAILLYENGEQVELGGGERIAFAFIRARLDQDEAAWKESKRRRSEAGRAGGRTSSSNAKQCQAMLSNAKQSQHVSVSVSESVSVSDSESVPSKEGEDGAKAPRTRHKYGQYENVLLSDEELEKLKKEFPFDWEERIERVSSYVAATGKKYKNFLATIRNWANRDKEKQKEEDGKWAVTPPEEQMPYPWEVE